MKEDNYGVIHFKGWNSSYIPHILKEIYLDRIYAPFLEGKENLTIFDCGANISLFSLYAAPYAKQIYAFEPALETYNLGLKNLTENNINNVKLFQQAIAKENGQIPFYHSINSTANSTMSVMNLRPELEEKVEAIRFDTFVEKEGITHIDFAKIDIEGSECEVIGGSGFQNITPILDSGVCEYHNWSGVNVQQLVTTLRDYGYTVSLIPSEAVLLGFTKK